MGILDYSVNDKRHFNSGRDYERIRIIKLLEKLDCGDSKCIHDQCCFSEEAIALIKGEQK
jgi:hypothetical protein